MDIPLNENFLEVTDYLKDRLQSQFFMVAVVLIYWSIWTSRNDLIFKGIQRTVNNARSLFRKEILLLLHRVNSRLTP